MFLIITIVFLTILYLREWTRVWDEWGNFYVYTKGLDIPHSHIKGFYHDKDDFRNIVVYKKVGMYTYIHIFEFNGLSGQPNRFYSFMKKHLW